MSDSWGGVVALGGGISIGPIRKPRYLKYNNHEYTFEDLVVMGETEYRQLVADMVKICESGIDLYSGITLSFLDAITLTRRVNRLEKDMEVLKKKESL